MKCLELFLYLAGNMSAVTGFSDNADQMQENKEDESR